MPLIYRNCNYCQHRYMSMTCRSQYCHEYCRKAAARKRKRDAAALGETTR